MLEHYGSETHECHLLKLRARNQPRMPTARPEALQWQGSLSLRCARKGAAGFYHGLEVAIHLAGLLDQSARCERQLFRVHNWIEGLPRVCSSGCCSQTNDAAL